MLDLLRYMKEGRNEVGEISKSMLVGPEALYGITEELSSIGLVGFETGSLTLPPGGKVRLAIYLRGKGASMHELGGALSWREFEVFAGSALEACGYDVRMNYRLKAPRREIDVVGILSGFGIAIDCKHWRRDVPSRLRPAAMMQKERVQLLLESRRIPGLKEILPALLVLSRTGLLSVEGVPIVPADGLLDFLTGARGCRAQLLELGDPSETPRGLPRHVPVQKVL
jgi:hypothetical protein